MSARYEESGCSADNFEDLLCADNDIARSLFESGAICPPQRQFYPIAGRGEYAQRLRAVIGRSADDYMRALEWEQQHEFPDRHIRKLRRRPRTAVSSPNERLIGAPQFCDAYSAVAFANSQGAVMNTLITLNWSPLGYEEDTKASAALQLEVIKHMREWYRHKVDPYARPFVWMYAHERSATVGLHTHLLVFIPYEWRAEFKTWLLRRLALVSRVRSMPKKAVHIVSARADRQLMHQWRLFGYLMKSANPCATLPVYPGSPSTVPLTDLIPWAHEGPGEVACRLRIGWAHELGASARAKHDYRSLLEYGITDVRLLYGDYDFKGWQWDEREESKRKRADSPKSDDSFARLTPDVNSERASADAEFRQQYEAWLQMAKGRDEVIQRAANVGTALPDFKNLFGGCAKAVVSSVHAWSHSLK